MIQNFAEDYNHFLPFVRFYFRHNIRVAISMLDSAPSDSLILDFGCGRKFLKQNSHFKNVVGYDVVKEFSDVVNYKDLKPKVIFCNHVLEHLNIHELKNVLDNFVQMKPDFIITGIPTENFISQVSAMLGKPKGYFEHLTKLNQIHKELSNRFILLNRRNVLTLTIQSKWKIR